MSYLPKTILFDDYIFIKVNAPGFMFQVMKQNVLLGSIRVHVKYATAQFEERKVSVPYEIEITENENSGKIPTELFKKILLESLKSF